MPIIDMTVKRGLNDEKLTRCMKELTAVIADTLENVLPRMVRVSITEVDTDYIRTGKIKPENSYAPTLHFQLGPGRKKESIMKCMDEMIEVVHHCLDVPAEDVSLYMHMIRGEQFAIGGKLKDFSPQKGK